MCTLQIEQLISLFSQHCAVPCKIHIVFRPYVLTLFINIFYHASSWFSTFHTRVHV